VRQPEIDGSKGPAGPAPVRKSIPRLSTVDLHGASHRATGLISRVRTVTLHKVTEIRSSRHRWMDSDSQVATFIVDGPGGAALGRLSMIE